MTVEKLKTAVENMNSYLEECHEENDTVVLTAKVIKSIKENYEELINFKNKADFVEVVRCEKCKYSNDNGTICRYSVGVKVEPNHFCGNGKDVE